MTEAAAPVRAGPGADDAGAARIALWLVLAGALAVRLWNLSAHVYIAHPDETFQYLEPAHRLAFGSGVVTWEFLDGIRSWFLPGMLAGLMRLVSAVDPDPRAYVLAIRALCVLASLSIPFVGFQLGRRYGLATAVLAGLLSAFASESVYFAQVIMTEPLATDAALLAVWLGDGSRDGPLSRRRLLGAGALFGLACCLRYQYAPVLAAAALVQHWRSLRGLVTVALGGLLVVLPVAGLLDALTWGAPFQSIWLNYLRNATQGVSGAMGAHPWHYYVDYYLTAWGVLAPVLVALAVIGAWRSPALAVLAIGAIGLHSMTPHKELRFVFLATACLPILVGLGLGMLMERFGQSRSSKAGVAVAVALGLAVSAYAATAAYGNATPPDAWNRDRSMLQATAAARAYPGACGLGVRRIWVYRSGGYAYWDRNLPIYFETWDAAQRLEHSPFPLRLASVIDGRMLPQYPGAALAANSGRFNVMIGGPSDGVSGFSRRGCYGEGSTADPTVCLFARPGGCG